MSLETIFNSRKAVSSAVCATLQSCVNVQACTDDVFACVNVHTCLLLLLWTIF